MWLLIRRFDQVTRKHGLDPADWRDCFLPSSVSPTTYAARDTSVVNDDVFARSTRRSGGTRGEVGSAADSDRVIGIIAYGWVRHPGVTAVTPGWFQSVPRRVPGGRTFGCLGRPVSSIDLARFMRCTPMLPFGQTSAGSGGMVAKRSCMQFLQGHVATLSEPVGGPAAGSRLPWWRSYRTALCAIR